MRFMVLLISLLAVSAAWSQQSSVPDVYATSMQFERVVILRFKFDTELLTGLREMVKKENIKNAVILNGAGSVRNYHVHIVGTRDFPPKLLYFEGENKPADILGISGYVINGRIHAHMTLMDGEKAIGGHIETGTNVYTFAAITLSVLPEGAGLSRLDNPGYRQIAASPDCACSQFANVALSHAQVVSAHCNWSNMAG